MKNLLLTLTILGISLYSMAQQSIIWEPEISVADGSIYGNTRPRLTLSTNDNPVVIFGGVGGALHIARLNGANFDSPTPIVPAGMETYLANWTGPDIAAHGDTVIAVFKAQPISTGNIYTVRSTDGGITFSDTIRADDHDIGESWMPAMDIDDNGNPVVTYMIFNAQGLDERIAVVHSTNAGLSYEPQLVVTATTNGVACDCCPPEVVVSGNTQLALFRNNESNIRDSYGSLSEDGGVSFTSDANLDNLNWLITSCPATGPAGVIIGDSAYVVSASRAAGTYRVYASAASAVGGLNLGDVTMMDPPTATAGDIQNFPRISGSNDTLVVVWEEKLSGNTDIICAVSTDGNSSSLGTYKSMVNASATGTQSKPDVIYKNGFVHVVYQDYASDDVIYRRGTIADVTGVNDLIAEQVHVSPNPTSGHIQISGLPNIDAEKIAVFNAQGQEVLFDSAINQNSIDLEIKDSKGNYQVVIYLINGSKVVKSVILN
ncbi:MAG: T9SS type A sorting domain-containing protein [Crocinitomicaceae bacterium]|nr:T9SS type A sorting domain-containing protein [Crocinitomicaceae bacterium]